MTRLSLLLGTAVAAAVMVHQNPTLAMEPTPLVNVVRIPAGGMQPDVVVDGAHVLHLVYLSGDPAAADVFYTTSRDGGDTFAAPIRVNSQPGSAIAVGTIRGAQLALGRDGSIHVVWNGSNGAEPKPPVRGDQKPGMPLLYARAAGAGQPFAPQRNLMTSTRHLDGGASIAADGAGAVYVVWHGNAIDGAEGEQFRRVWLARSTDDGRTFGAETAISPADTGTCGCCGLEAAASGANVYVLYRGAREQVHRDVHALTSLDGGRTFTARLVDRWENGACPMSSMTILPGRAPLYAWEHDGQVAFSEDTRVVAPAPPNTEDPKARRKHPRLALAADGNVLLTWATGAGWNKGGGVAWQMFADGVPTTPIESGEGLPVWSFPTVAALSGRFVVLY